VLGLLFNINMRLFLPFLCLVIALNTFGQAEIIRLEEIGQRMLQDENPDIRHQSQLDFSKLIDSLLQNANFFDWDLGKVKSLSAIASPDREFKLYTWNEPLENGEFRFYGRIFFKPVKGEKLMTVKLEDKHKEISKPKNKKLQPSEWFGAVYYQIVKKSHKRTNYYVLLGWNGNSTLSTMKVIDVLVWNPKTESISLGAPIFTGNQTLHRVIFEYAKQSSMSLKYQDKADRIVFDHLSPMSLSMKDQFEFYSPDFTYDSYQWKKGKFHFEKNIDARNDGLNEGNQDKKPEKGLAPKKP
jgi:hypothetical protein